jgi:hypothetical protein
MQWLMPPPVLKQMVKKRPELSRAAVRVRRADGFAYVAVGRKQVHDRVGVASLLRRQAPADDITRMDTSRAEYRWPEVTPSVDW